MEKMEKYMNTENKYSSAWVLVHIVGMIVCASVGLYSFSEPIDFHVRTDEMLQEYQEKSRAGFPVESTDDNGNKVIEYIS